MLWQVVQLYAGDVVWAIEKERINLLNNLNSEFWNL